jgi:uncharacterized delta-60 repeat protein
MKKFKFLLLTAFFALFTVPGISASPGDPDPAFGKAGFLTKSLSGRERSNQILVQPDGKFIVIGMDNFTGGPVPTAIRYNPDGSQDSSFDSDGVAQVGLGQANGAALQTDGKIVIVGTFAEKGEVRLSALRLNTDGSLDTTFAGDGVFTDAANGAFADAVAIQTDGKIVITGSERDAFFQFDYVTIRLNTDGTFDTGFGGGDGKVLTGVTSTQAGGTDTPFAIAIQADGKIIVGGESLIPGSDLEFTLLRYETDGTLDPTFDSDGIASVGFGGNRIDRLREIAIDSNGKIVVSGFGNDGTIQGGAFVRLNTDGSLDTSFSDDGKLIVPSLFIAGDVAIQPDGKIIGGGGIVAFDLIRLNTNGTIDTTFGVGGFASTQIFDSGNAGILDLKLDSDGNIFATGSAINGNIDDDFAFAKFTPDGNPSASFGTFGYSLSTPFDANLNRSLVANAVAVQSNGKIIAGGTADFNNNETYGYIARYNSNGRIDNPFGTSFNGFAMISIPNATDHEVNAITIQPDGKILVAGEYLSDTNGGTFLARFNPDGERDLNFGNNGYATVSVFSGGALGRDLFLLPDGKILVAGATVNIITQIIKPALFKFNADGSLDSGFGSGGRVTTSFSSGNDVALSLDVLADGKIIIAGGSNFDLGGTNGMIALARFTSAGSLDNTFGTGGKVTTDVGTFIDTAADVKVQPDGKIVIGGASCTDGNCNGGRGLLFRYNSNGSLDTTFDGDGKIVLQSNPPGQNTAIGAIALQADNKIIVSGVTTTTATQSDTLVARFNTDGSFDTGFGTGGIATSDIGGTNQFVFDVILQADGKIVTAGSSEVGTRTDFAVWRFLGDGTTAPVSNTKFDFDGDGKADVSIFRPGPNPGQWWYLRSSDFDNRAFGFGLATDTLVPADFTGDGKTDIAFWRETTGEWFVLRSEDNSFYAVPFGSAGDIPAPGDFDGDGMADTAVFRPSTATWFIDNSGGGTTIVPFGIPEDKPVIADYDGDGKDDIAIYRPSVKQWWLNRSSDGVLAYEFGTTGDKTVQGDYTGDGKADSAIFRPATGEWFVIRSEDLSFYSVPFGISTDIPTPGDYDGDGRFDTAVFRPSENNWYVQGSTSGFFQLGFGIAGDVPVPNVYSVE